MPSFMLSNTGSTFESSFASFDPFAAFPKSSSAASPITTPILLFSAASAFTSFFFYLLAKGSDIMNFILFACPLSSSVSFFIGTTFESSKAYAIHLLLAALVAASSLPSLELGED